MPLLALLQVLRRTGADVYARSPAEWQQRCAAAAAVRSDFAAMLGDNDAPAATAVPQTADSTGRGRDGALDGATQQGAGAAGGSQKAAKKRAKAPPAAAAEAPAADGEAAARDADTPKKKVNV